MSIIFELFKTSGKKVCPPNYVRKSNCPLIVRTTSEDLLTANVFGILKNLDPTIWLRRFLGEAIKGKDFSRHTFENLSFEFWKRYRPPANRKYQRREHPRWMSPFLTKTGSYSSRPSILLP